MWSSERYLADGTYRLAPSMSYSKLVFAVNTDLCARGTNLPTFSQLLKKFGCYGITPNIVLILESFPNGRHLYVELRAFKSFYFTSSARVPEGSNLGPVSFLIFLDDLCYIIYLRKFLFADDFKIFREITDVPDFFSKCRVMSYSRKITTEEFD